MYRYKHTNILSLQLWWAKMAKMLVFAFGLLLGAGLHNVEACTVEYTYATHFENTDIRLSDADDVNHHDPFSTSLPGAPEDTEDQESKEDVSQGESKKGKPDNGLVSICGHALASYANTEKSILSISTTFILALETCPLYILYHSWKSFLN